MRNSIIKEDIEFIISQALPWEMFQGKTILITGAAGFLPSYMVETLLCLNEIKRLNIRVIGIVRNLEKAKMKFDYFNNNPNFELIEHDVCESLDIPEKLDFIIHAASPATPKVFADDPIGTLSPNVLGTANLLKLGVSKRVECFLFFSTSGVYGHVGEECYPVREDCFGALNPTEISSCYLESKRMGENMCVAWMQQYGIPVKIVRPAITYGPGIKLDDGRSFADFVSNIINRRNIEIYSDGKAIRNFCYIADATLGFFTVMLKGKAGEAYNVATDHEISILELAEVLVGKVFPELDLKVVMKNNPEKFFLRVNYARTTVDISKAKSLGWELHYPIEIGFKRAVESFLIAKNGKDL